MTHSSLLQTSVLIHTTQKSFNNLVVPLVNIRVNDISGPHAPSEHSELMATELWNKNHDVHV